MGSKLSKIGMGKSSRPNSQLEARAINLAQVHSPVLPSNRFEGLPIVELHGAGCSKTILDLYRDDVDGTSLLEVDDWKMFPYYACVC